MYQLVYNHYFKKGIFSSLCALEAKNSKSVPFTELSHLAKFTLLYNSDYNSYCITVTTTVTV